MKANFEEELAKAIDRVISSESPKKLIVAGPGTGKTTLFRKLLEVAKGEKTTRIILTFLNNLKQELEEKLSDFAQVFTFHGYCHSLLRRTANLRRGLTKDFSYFPGVASLIKDDWEIVNGNGAPKFVGLMRDLKEGAETAFYLERSNYYDAVEFDDSVFRVHQALIKSPDSVDTLDLVLVDEYQDFNRLEASFIDLLAQKSPITIVGDDDQALYSQLRGSSHEFIRHLHEGGEYERFELPFCLRCPEVIIDAVSDLINKARAIKKLHGRIEKPYLYYPPRKASDSEQYPAIKSVSVSTQLKNTNYMGKYISQEISRIPEEEIKESRTEGFPTALIIGPVQYLRQIGEHLRNEGYDIETKEDSGSTKLVRDDALKVLHGDPESNLGWRISLELDQPSFKKVVVRESVKNIPLYELVPAEYKEEIIKQAEAWSEKTASIPPAEAIDLSKPSIRLTSFEGSKGLSAQHVFILGLQTGELPRDVSNIDDLEICKFIVALTRTRKQCQLIYTWRFGGKPKRPSGFISWISPKRKESITIDKNYWKRLGPTSTR